MKKISELYQSTDFYFTVSAKTAGVRIHNSERDKDKKTVWFFERSPHLDRIIEGYYAGTLSLPVHALFYNQRLLKTQISSKNIQ